MTKIRKIVASFIGIFLIGSSTNTTNATAPKNKVESKIQNIFKALYSKKIQSEQSKRIFEYLEENHKLNSIEAGKKTESEEGEMNVGNWDTWSNWNNWDTWSNWNNWDTWSNWNNWDTWSNWSNYQA